MNPITEKRPITLLTNPFFYVAGGKALGLGLGAIVLAGLVGALGNTHFDGVLDTHVGASVPLWVFLAEGVIDWLCLAGVLLVLGLLVSKTAFRALDVLGTQALARWPSVVLALLMLPGAVRRFSGELAESLRRGGGLPALNTPDAIVFLVLVVASIPVVCFMVYLMYKAYSVSCNVRGWRGIGSFIGGLIVGEVVSKLCVGLVLSHVLAGTGLKAHAPVAPQGAGSSNVATNLVSHGVVEAAGHFVSLLAKEDFAGAVGQFDATMKKALPEASLRAAWESVLKQAGAFQKQTGTRTKELAGHRVVLVGCQFEHGTLDVKVVYDAEDRIAGLWFVPSGSG